MPRPVSPYNAVAPTPEDMAAVKTALERVDASHRLDFDALPQEAAGLIRRMLEDYAAGKRLHLIPEDAEVSTFQAAEILNVSRPYVIKRLEDGEIPFHMVGTHRRIRLDDLLAYKQRKDADADAAMDELVAQAQELKLGY